jgi:pimeloyl-ACP methyl ester carboxylesterase
MLNYKIYRNSNTDTWVTFIHGAGGSSSIWFRQLKVFKLEFNILLIDLRGHGRSKSSFNINKQQDYTFDIITDDIIEVLNHLNIKKSHFVGISLGTILIRYLADKRPNMVEKMVLGGAILEFNLFSKVLIRFGDFFKSIIPYMVLYKLFAFIIMPKKNHKESRLLFGKEAKKICQKEFIRWYKLTSTVIPILRLFTLKEVKIPTLYVMGDQDHLFLPSILKVSRLHKTATLYIIKNCGHVVNIEHPVEFNRQVISYLKSKKTIS